MRGEAAAFAAPGRPTNPNAAPTDGLVSRLNEGRSAGGWWNEPSPGWDGAEDWPGTTRKTAHAEAMIKVAMIRLMAARLAGEDIEPHSPIKTEAARRLTEDLNHR